MKKNLLISFLVLLFALGKAQNFNSAFHEYNDVASSLTSVDNNYYFWSETFTPGVYIFQIYSVNNLGALRFKKSFVKHGYTHLNKIISALDKKIVLIGYGNGCDYLDNTQNTFIVKKDTNGNTIFDNTFNNMYSGGNDYLKDVIQYPDSSYFAITDSVLFHFNKNGSLIKKKSTNISLLSSLTFINNNRLLVCGKTSGSFKHFEIDTNGIIINQGPSSMAVNKYVRTSTGSIIALLQNNTLQKLTKGLIIVSSSSVNQGVNNLLNDFEISQDSIFSCGSNNVTKTPIYIKFDTLFNNISQFNPSSKNIIPTAITLNAMGNVGVLNNCTSNFTTTPFSMHSPFISLTQTNKQGIFNYNKDIGVISSVLDSSTVTSLYSGGATVYFASYRLKVIVKNFGTDSVKQFYLNHKIRPSISCGTYFYHQKFNLALAPGATTTLITQYVYAGDIGVYSGSPASGSYPFNVCVYTSIPDNQNDFNINNDKICNNFMFPFVLGINETTSSSNEISINPNPFNEFIKLNSENINLTKVEVLDASGKLILTKDVLKTSNYNLNTSELPNGFYLIRIYNDSENFVIRKMVK